MSVDSTANVRTARRQDAAAIADLRVHYLAEISRLDARLKLLPDARERTENALPVWVDQQDRVLLVAETAGSSEVAPTLCGYATGLASVWPPVFRNQRVGEITELFVAPPYRGGGMGRQLLAVLTDTLRRRGSEVLRSVVVHGNRRSLERFGAEGYSPLYRVLVRSLEEG